MRCVVRETPVYYESYGTGIPIIAIHGFTPDHRLMKGSMELLFAERPGWRRIYLDLPGMGQTPGTERINSTDDVLDLVVDFIEEIIPGQRFLLAGESYGGYISRGALLRRFERVEGMALICPLITPGISRRELPPHTVIAENPQLLASLDPAEAEEFGPMAVVQDTYNWERFRDEILSGLRVADTAFLDKIRRRYAYSFDVDHLLQVFTKPVVMIMGRQDSSVGYRDAWKILENYPRATFAVLDRAGHNAHIEQGHLFNTLMGEWLDRVQEAMQAAK